MPIHSQTHACIINQSQQRQQEQQQTVNKLLTQLQTFLGLVISIIKNNVSMQKHAEMHEAFIFSSFFHFQATLFSQDQIPCREWRLAGQRALRVRGESHCAGLSLLLQLGGPSMGPRPILSLVGPRGAAQPSAGNTSRQCCYRVGPDADREDVNIEVEGGEVLKDDSEVLQW